MRTLIAGMFAVSVVMAGRAAAEDAKPALTDPQIATVALTAHRIDIERGKLAQKKTNNPEVKQFADQMVTDHSQGEKEVLALAKKLKVKPVESEVTKGLKSEAADKLLLLKKLDGADFDKAYVDAEVAYHEGVVAAIDQVLIPGAKNAELKTALENTRPTIAGHLEHAKGIQKLLAAPPTPAPAPAPKK